MENLPQPQSRIEVLLDAFIRGDTSKVTEPQSRIEDFWYFLIDGTNSLPIPQSRTEELMKKIIENDDTSIPLAYSRTEEFLIAMLTGDTDNLPQPQSRKEEYLNYIARHNLIVGNIEYVTYKGTNIVAQNTVEKPINSAILKGQTLVNILDYNNNVFDDYTSINENFEIVHESKNSYGEVYLPPMFQHNGSCLIKCCVIENSLTESFFLNKDYQSTSLIKETLEIPVGYVGEKTFIINTTYTGTETLLLRGETGMACTGAIKFKVMVIPYQEGMENWDIPYFEGMSSVKMPVLTTTGKNLFDNVLSNRENVEVIVNNIGDNEYSIQTENTNLWDSQNIYKKIPIKKGETIHWYGYFKNMANIRMYLNGFDTLVANHQPTTISTDYEFFDLKYTATSDGFVLCRFWLNGVNSIGYLKDIMFELNSKTTYEPFKSNILSTPSDLELRSNGSVCDELDLITGQLTQRIDENGDVLAQEVIKTVDLVIVDQNNNKVNKLSAFNDVTHITSSSESGSLLAEFEISVPTKIIESLNEVKSTLVDIKAESDTVEVAQKIQNVNSLNTMIALTEVYELALTMGDETK